MRSRNELRAYGTVSTISNLSGSAPPARPPCAHASPSFCSPSFIARCTQAPASPPIAHDARKQNLLLVGLLVRRAKSSSPNPCLNFSLPSGSRVQRFVRNSLRYRSPTEFSDLHLPGYKEKRQPKGCRFSAWIS